MWNDLTMSQKAELIQLAVKSGIKDVGTIRSIYDTTTKSGTPNVYQQGGNIYKILDRVNSSRANFVQRLKDPNRKYTPDWSHKGHIATHKLSVGTDPEGHHYIYPEVQEINGQLVDFTRPIFRRHAGAISAAERGDTVRVPSIQEGIEFTKNYKRFYPKGNTFAEGGPLDWLSEKVEDAKNTATRIYNNLTEGPYKRAYRTVTPANYNIKQAIGEFISGRTRDIKGTSPARNEEWATYLGVPYEGESSFEPSPYRPTKGKTYGKVVRFKDESQILSDAVIQEALNRKKNTGKSSYLVEGNGTGLGTYTISLGKDANGDYASYYDDWDINPFKGISANTNIPIISGIENIVPGTNPFTVYGRRYYNPKNFKAKGGSLDDDVIEEVAEIRTLPEIVVTPNRNSPEELAIEEAYQNRFNNARLDIPIDNTAYQNRIFMQGIQQQRSAIHNNPWMWGLRGLVAAPAAVGLAGLGEAGTEAATYFASRFPHTANGLSTMYKIGKPLVETYFGYEGGKNLISDEGIAKTHRLAKQGKIDPAIESGLGDLLDATMIGAGIKGAIDLFGSTVRGAKKAIEFAPQARSFLSDLYGKGMKRRWNAYHDYYTSQNDKINNLRRNYLADERLAALEERSQAHKLNEKVRQKIFDWERQEHLDGYSDYIAYNKKVSGKHANPARNAPTNWQAMSEQDRIKFFEGKVDNPVEAAKYYNPKTGLFEIEESTPMYESGFNPNKVVETGEIELKDFETGQVNKFNITPAEPNAELVVQHTYTPSSTALVGKKYKKSIPTMREKPIESLAPTMPKEYVEAVQKNMDYVTDTILPGSRPFGSSTNVAKGNLAHGTHDIDVIMTEAQAMKHPNFKEFEQKIPGATYGWNHPQAGELDINIIRENSGKAYGVRAHELYAQMYPKEYRNLMMKYAEKGKKLSTDLPLDKSAQELLDNYDPIVKGIADAFGSGKQKHMGRAIYYLHFGDTNDVRKGFETYANYLLGGDYKASQLPLSIFEDPIANKVLVEQLKTELDLSGINANVFADDPQRMKLLFDYAIFDKTFFGRGVSAATKSPIKSLTYWYPETNGGTAYGVGLNTVIGGNSQHGDVYGILVPKRFPKIEGNTPAELLQSIPRDRALTDAEITKVMSMAKEHNIPIQDPANFGDILRATQGKVGKNYKAFINELAEEFDLSHIENLEYHSGVPYASLLEDQPKESIKQLIIGNMDRPTTARQRSYAVNDGAVGISTDIKPFYDATQAITTRDAGKVMYPQTQRVYNLGRLSNKRLQKAQAKVNDIAEKKRAFQEQTELLFPGEHLAQLYDNYEIYEHRLHDIRELIRNLAMVGASFPVTYGITELVNYMNNKAEREELEEDERHAKWIEERKKGKKNKNN